MGSVPNTVNIGKVPKNTCKHKNEDETTKIPFR